jgi:hypothetical protein
MPRPGDIDTTYPHKFKEIDIELIEPFQGAKLHHKMRCLNCFHEWTATPISKLQNFKRHKLKGCPVCCRSECTEKVLEKRKRNLQSLKDRGFEILSDWDGRRVNDISNVPTKVTVRNMKCNHRFTSEAKNLLARGVECPICATQYKTNHLNASVERRHQKWIKTATSWQLYKSEVTSHTRATYLANKHTINPNNLPSGRAGKDGAYHLDHIVPVRYCFENDIPAKICSDLSNLQMIPWRENIASKARLKGKIPVIFEQFGVNNAV